MKSDKEQQGKLSKLKQTFTRGGISRREFLQGVMALGLTAAGASTFISRVEAAMPKSGGTLRLGLADPATTDVLDPATYISNHTQIGMFGAVQNNLTEVAPNGDIIPELAESFEASPDAKVWTFELRKGVEFHNGKSFEAEDVLASINHHRGEDSKSSAKSLLEEVVDVRVDGKHTVVFELSGGNADFPFVVNDYHLTIVPAKDGKADWQKGVGTGGYVLKDFDPGVRMTATRNPNYWKEGHAHFEALELLAIADVTARQNALVTGEIDAINRVDRKTAHLLAKQSGVAVDETTGNQHYTIPMNTTVAPFDNADVRLALKLAIDREALVQTILRGHGRVANDHPIGPGQRFFAGDLEQRVYDPDKAKAHLKKAGMDSLKVKLHAADTAFEGAIDTAVLYKEHAAKAGINIEVVREPNDGYWSNVWMKEPWSMSYWGGRSTEDWMFTIGYAAGGSWNETFWSNDRFMELLTAARAELDIEKRRAMYREMQQLVRDDGGAVIPMYANFVDGRSEKVAHPEQVASNWELDGWKLCERWWFA